MAVRFPVAKSPLYLTENFPGGRLPPVLWRSPVGLLSQKRRRPLDDAGGIPKISRKRFGDSIPDCEISSLLDKELARWSTASCALVLACYLKKEEEKKIFTLIMNIKDIHMRSKNYERNGYVHDLELVIISRTNCVFFMTYKQSGAERKVSE